jgi:CspA family cold shock protein
MHVNDLAADITLGCADCGSPFVWTAAEQRLGPAPVHCPMCSRLAPAPGRSRGIVKWYSRARGYGFITPIEGADLFVHKSALSPDHPALRAGQLVEFNRTTTASGVQAGEVVVLEQEG